MTADNSTRPLSDLAIRKLKVDTLLADVGENRGLRVSKGRTGVTVFVYRYRSPIANAKGQNPIRQIKIGTYPELTLHQARIELVKLKALRDSGVCPSAKRKAAKAEAAKISLKQAQAQSQERFTVLKLVDRYLDGHVDRERKAKGASEARRTLYGDAVRVYGHRPATDINSADVMSLINEILDRGANVQAGNVLRELLAAYDFSIDKLPEGFDNPCYSAKGKLKQRRVRLTSTRGKRVLSDVELAELLTWLPGSRYTPVQKNVLLFTLMTGARTGEVCTAYWRDIDLESGTWHLRETKTFSERYVQLSTQAIEFLKPLMRITGDCLFPSQKTGLPIKQKQLTMQSWHMRKNGQFIDLPKWTPHDLRRSVRTGLARMSCPSEVGEAILGHARSGIEGTYDLHSYEPECRVWLQKWCDHLDELVKC